MMAADIDIATQQLANDMAVAFRAGDSLDEIAGRHATTVPLVQKAIAHQSTYEIGQLITDRRHNMLNAEWETLDAEEQHELRHVKANLSIDDWDAAQVERDKAMVADIMAGASLATVGAANGVGRERVRQIVFEQTGLSVKQIRAQLKVQPAA